MQMLAVDPAKSKPVAIAEFCGPLLALNNIYRIPLARLLNNPAEVVPYSEDPDKVAVIEHPWSVKHPGSNLSFAVAIGEIRQALRSQGFRIVPVYAAFGPKGSNSWIREMFAVNGRPPKREIAKAMAMKLARAEFPGVTFNEDTADAACIGLWARGRIRRGMLPGL